MAEITIRTVGDCRDDIADGRVPVAILGPGNIGLDLMHKIVKRSKKMHLVLMAGTPDSTRLHIAKDAGVPCTEGGIDDILKDPRIEIVFDATLASAHMNHAPKLQKAGKVAIDLTPAAIGGQVCPAVNMGDHLDEMNINLITCGGQATIPIVAAINAVSPVAYAEIVACIARDSAGPGTRESIDEFTITTAKALSTVGGARKAKAIILLNPSSPPIMMSNTIYCIVDEMDEIRVDEAVKHMICRVQSYVPGYRLKVPPIIDGNKVTIMIEIEGAGDYLPVYSGNLDIETSCALAVGEMVAARLLARRSPHG
jgi:acetaldehyde dehydrogenase